MKIIAIEGLDKSGKHTQAKMIAARLAMEGVPVELSEFHRYDTPTGELIAKWLRKEYDVDQKTIELIMAADKQAQQAWFTELEEQGVEFLILDRYIDSQFAYSKAAGMSTSWVDVLLINVRPPDLTIFIDIPPEVSMSRKGKHNNGENDRYESDLDLLTNVRRNFKQLCSSYSSYRSVTIDGTKSVEEIHEEIWTSVSKAYLV